MMDCGCGGDDKCLDVMRRINLMKKKFGGCSI